MENILYRSMSAVIAVDPSAEWMHGTRAKPFDIIHPGTCFTTDYRIAVHFAQSGSYQHPETQHGKSRILTARIKLPDGAPHLQATSEFHKIINMYNMMWVGCADDVIERNNGLCQLRAQYHGAAAERARRLGYLAYFEDMYGADRITKLVVLDPTVVHIVSQNIYTDEHVQYGLCLSEDRAGDGSTH